LSSLDSLIAQSESAITTASNEPVLVVGNVTGIETVREAPAARASVLAEPCDA